MTDIVASIGLKQLDRYDSLLARRREIIALYNKILADNNINVLEHCQSQHSYLRHIQPFRQLAMYAMAKLFHFCTYYKHLGNLFDVLFSGDDWKGSERYNRAEKEYGKYGISIELNSNHNGKNRENQCNIKK